MRQTKLLTFPVLIFYLLLKSFWVTLISQTLWGLLIENLEQLISLISSALAVGLAKIFKFIILNIYVL
uniref:Uncharacterized protein n=1 Tax=Monilinia laxa TaxID=61186 RepID=A0A7L8EXZ8_MONLA|nr:hypothetical protein [Monilinia laxa]QOE17390.1 hypothetical protein [Monilinia laxa]